MCTVTIVPHDTGIRLVCNRDERRSRPAALPPRRYRLGRRVALFPEDPEGGGTWVGVNDAGFAVALLNVNDAPLRARGEPTTSRGHIVTALLRCATLADARCALAAHDWNSFKPFRIVAVQGRTALVITRAGSLACVATPCQRPLLFTSSSLGDRLVHGPRRRLFRRLVSSAPDGWLAGQSRFHDHQWPRRPAISVRMQRDDALTVSRTAIEISGRQSVLSYEAPLGADSVRGVLA